jgi:hypothetical protein
VQTQRRSIGLLAGSGRFPILFAERARQLGISVVGVGIRHEAPRELEELTDRFYRVDVSKLGRMIRCFKRERVERIVMAGKITKAVMYTPWRILQLWPDLRTIRFWLKRQFQARDNKDDSLLLAMIDEFRRDGMDFDSALMYCPDLLARPGVLTRKRPSAEEEKDIAFGWTLAKEMGRLDVGQSVAVKERAVLAVEAIEGTDRSILRAGELCPAGGFTVQAAARHALRRADHRSDDDREPPQGPRPGARHRGREDHRHRPARNRGPRRPARHHDRGGEGVMPMMTRSNGPIPCSATRQVTASPLRRGT